MRLIDADELEKQFGLYCAGECECCKHYEYVDYRTGGCCCTLITKAKTVALPNRGVVDVIHLRFADEEKEG